MTATILRGAFQWARMPTGRGLDLIKRWETFQARPYVCAGGYWTIGYGAIHGLDGARVTARHRPITEAEADALLRRDVVDAAGAVTRLCPVPLDDGQFDALLSFTFNLGGGALQASTLRRRVIEMDVDGATAQFHRWIFAGGQKLRGLVLRRAEEASLYQGDWEARYGEVLAA